MNRKDKLYYDLIDAYRNHSCNDTLIDTYIYKVLKLVKDYLDFDNLKKENQELKYQNKNLKDIDDGWKFVAKERANLLEKYIKVIDILKKFNFKLGQYGNGEYYILIYYSGITIEIILTQEQYYLLEEVLGNEK